MKAFEIVYADGTLVAGSTREDFERAPDDGVQFVIVRDEAGAVRVMKALSKYEYEGVVKPGSWTETENYFALRARLLEISNLLVDRSVRISRRPSWL